jgi:hypothetical protein
MQSRIGVYITTVLVPEMATRLIMQDNNIVEENLEQGRRLLRKTVRMGQILHPDEDEKANDEEGEGDGMDWWRKEQDDKLAAELAALDEEEEEGAPGSQESIFIGDD